jgi:hypothetical protein
MSQRAAKSRYAGELMIQKLKHGLGSLGRLERQKTIRLAIDGQRDNIIRCKRYHGKHDAEGLALQRKYAPQTLPTEFKLIRFPGR